ncbi:hypothetical protein [Ferribacterium limneticum]|uniref:hypothetical protein n=1 Tax=Ferribacterium limneticum TaxID=76259 RepID=UPI001CFBA030|nr:hypothetical protein [Ferribacterium limneticum]UCV17849.1 hypothetical protein KI610_13615 [Ferribacterium limneticum]
MKITTADGAPLMEVSDIRIVGDKIVFEGKIMGGIPMKAFVPPKEIWVLVRMVWFKKAFNIVWLLMKALFKSEKR